MRHLPPLACGLLAVLAGCTDTKPDGTETTMDLLRAGDGAVCIAADVENSFRGLVRPEGPEAERAEISLSAVSLRAFDKQTSKAECSANLTIRTPSGTLVDGEGVTYTIAPAAQDPNTFIVSAAVGLHRAQLRAAIENEQASVVAGQQQQAQQESFLALVKPGWLIGRWVKMDQGSRACVDGPYLDFGRNNVLRGPHVAGRWKLTDTELQLITPDQAATYLITEADELNVEFSNAEGPVDRYRRCTKDDAASYQPPPDPFAGLKAMYKTYGVSDEPASQPSPAAPTPTSSPDEG